MSHDGVIARLAEQVSGVRILDAATELARLQRTPASPGYHEAVGVVTERLAQAGIASDVHTYPADGASKTYEWTAPPAWVVWSGRLIETGDGERVLADFDDTAQAVVVHSPGGRFEAEVAHVGTPVTERDYEKVDLAGKVALVCARASEAVVQAARRGAVGVVVYPSDERAAVSHDLVVYHSIFPRRDEIAGLVPAFSVSRRVADRLVRSLAKGPVVVRGEIDAEFGQGGIEVVEAAVPGTCPGRGVLFTAHLCHPRGSANDNASGAAALIELAQAFSRLSLRPSARFLWMPEFYGSLPWAAERVEALRDTELVLNLDMVGASPERIGEPLRVFRAANHTPHFVNALVEPVATQVAADTRTRSTRGSTRLLHWVFDLPSGGSDHLVFAAPPHRLPALMLGHDDPYWHSDFDTADKLDPSRLKQAAVLAGALAAATTPDSNDVVAIWDEMLAHSTRELVRAVHVARGLDAKDGSGLLDLALAIEVERSRSVRAIGRVGQEERARLLRSVRDSLAPRSPRGRDDRGLRPRRKTDGPLVYDLGGEVAEEERAFFKERFGANHRASAEGLVNHCDGTATVDDIAGFLSLDSGRSVPPDDVRRGIAFLEAAGVVEWAEEG